MEPDSNYMPEDQFNLLLENVPKLEIYRIKHNDLVMLFKITRWLGLRISETLRLEAKDFNFDRPECFLGKTKGSKMDIAVIPPKSRDEIKQYLEGKEGKLFNVSRVTVWSWLKKLGVMLSIPSLTEPEKNTGEKTVTHIFRKSMAKDMLYAGAPLNIVQFKLRHKDIQSTSKYLKASNQAVKDWEQDHPL